MPHNLEPKNTEVLANFFSYISEHSVHLIKNLEIVSDATLLRDASSQEPYPKVLYFKAQNADSIKEIVKHANRFKIPVVTRGSGTGLSGGAVPDRPSVVIDVSALKRILSLDVERKRLTVEPGVTLGEIEELLDPLGYMYPPDPASYMAASIGGTVATNAGGLRCVKYGVTRDWVQSLEIILADGNASQLGKDVVKDSTGFDLKNLFIGSEGTLGVISAVTLKIIPKPKHRNLYLVSFKNALQTFSFVQEVLKTITPSMCEVLDSGALQTRDTSPLEPFLGSLDSWGEDPTLLMFELDGDEIEEEQNLFAEKILSNGLSRACLLYP